MSNAYCKIIYTLVPFVVVRTIRLALAIAHFEQNNAALSVIEELNIE